MRVYIITKIKQKFAANVGFPMKSSNRTLSTEKKQNQVHGHGMCNYFTTNIICVEEVS